MKKILIKLIACFLVSIFLFSCNKDDAIDCEIDNDFSSLEWLCEKATNLKNNSDLHSASIAFYTLEQDTLFATHLNWTGVNDLPSSRIYTLEGEQLYVCGGNQPTNPCAEFHANAIRVRTIWEKQ